MGILRYKGVNSRESFEKGMDKIKELHKLEYDLKWCVFHASTGYEKSSFSEKAKDLSKKVLPREVEKFTNFDDLTTFIDETCKFYDENLVGYYQREKSNYYNEAGISIDKESEFSYRFSLSVMRMGKSGGSGVISIGISMSDRDVLIKKETKDLKEPYKSNLSNYIKYSFVPDEYYFREESMFGKDQKSWLEIFDDYWNGRHGNKTPRRAKYEELDYGCSRESTIKIMGNTCGLIKEAMKKEGYIVDDFEFEIESSFIKIVNTYIGLGHCFRVDYEIRTWSEDEEIDLLEDDD